MKCSETKIKATDVAQNGGNSDHEGRQVQVETQEKSSNETGSPGVGNDSIRGSHVEVGAATEEEVFLELKGLNAQSMVAGNWFAATQTETSCDQWDKTAEAVKLFCYRHPFLMAKYEISEFDGMYLRTAVVRSADGTSCAEPFSSDRLARNHVLRHTSPYMSASEYDDGKSLSAEQLMEMIDPRLDSDTPEMEELVEKGWRQVITELLTAPFMSHVPEDRRETEIEEMMKSMPNVNRETITARMCVLASEADSVKKVARRPEPLRNLPIPMPPHSADASTLDKWRKKHVSGEGWWLEGDGKVLTTKKPGFTSGKLESGHPKTSEENTRMNALMQGMVLNNPLLCDSGQITVDELNPHVAELIRDAILGPAGSKPQSVVYELLSRIKAKGYEGQFFQLYTLTEATLTLFKQIRMSHPSTFSLNARLSDFIATHPASGVVDGSHAIVRLELMISELRESRTSAGSAAAVQNGPLRDLKNDKWDIIYPHALEVLRDVDILLTALIATIRNDAPIVVPSDEAVCKLTHDDVGVIDMVKAVEFWDTGGSVEMVGASQADGYFLCAAVCVTAESGNFLEVEVIGPLPSENGDVLRYPRDANVHCALPGCPLRASDRALCALHAMCDTMDLLRMIAFHVPGEPMTRDDLRRSQAGSWLRIDDAEGAVLREREDWTAVQFRTRHCTYPPCKVMGCPNSKYSHGLCPLHVALKNRLAVDQIPEMVPTYGCDEIIPERQCKYTRTYLPDSFSEPIAGDGTPSLHPATREERFTMIRKYPCLEIFSLDFEEGNPACQVAGRCCSVARRGRHDCVAALNVYGVDICRMDIALRDEDRLEAIQLAINAQPLHFDGVLLQIMRVFNVMPLYVRSAPKPKPDGRRVGTNGAWYSMTDLFTLFNGMEWEANVSPHVHRLGRGLEYNFFLDQSDGFGSTNPFHYSLDKLEALGMLTRLDTGSIPKRDLFKYPELGGRSGLFEQPLPVTGQTAEGESLWSVTHVGQEYITSMLRKLALQRGYAFDHLSMQSDEYEIIVLPKYVSKRVL